MIWPVEGRKRERRRGLYEPYDGISDPDRENGLAVCVEPFAKKAMNTVSLADLHRSIHVWSSSLLHEEAVFSTYTEIEGKLGDS